MADLDSAVVSENIVDESCREFSDSSRITDHGKESLR